MASAAEIIYNIKNLKAGGKSVDDKSISDFQWLYIIDSYRSQLLKNQQAKGQSINEQCVQKLLPSKITLTQNPIEKCELYTNDIPKVIEGVKSNMFTYVGNEGGVAYQRTTYSKSAWDKYGATSKLPKWYEVGSRISVRNHNKNIKLSIMGLFESPMEVELFNGTLDEMNPFNFVYPISSTMVDTIVKMIADSEIKLSLMLAQDNLNNGKEDIKSN